MVDRLGKRLQVPKLILLVLILLLNPGGNEGWGAEIIRLQPDGTLVIVSGAKTAYTPVLVAVQERPGGLPRIIRLGKGNRRPPLPQSQQWSPPAQATALPGSMAPAALSELIHKYATRHGVDPQLVHLVIKTESGYQPQAVSPKGAMGLMQLMPGTAALLGVRDPFDVEQNLEGGIRYLKMCLERFNNQVPLALAAYNAGPENVSRYQGIPPFAETVAYVKKIMNAYSGQPLDLPAISQVQTVARPEKHKGTGSGQPPLYFGPRARLLVSYLGQAKVINIQRF